MDKLNYKTDMARIAKRAALTTTLVTCLSIAATQVSVAQFNPPTLPSTSYLYTTSFVCGTAEPARDVQSTGDAFLSPYDDLEAGNYATLLTLHNTSAATRNVGLYVSAQGLSGSLFIETISIPARQSRRFGCLNFMDEIRDNFASAQLFGQAVQGSVYFTQFDDSVDLTTTQTFSARRLDGDAGVGGVSVDVDRLPPREVAGLFVTPLPNP